jgi:UDP-GlcNAc:undecaprenyl-phosphate GlcNAc-1-phosphate transferase
VNIATLLIVLGGSTIVSGLSVYLSIALANRWGVFDHPDMERKVQDHPIPKLGGLAVALVFIFGTVVTVLLSGRSELLPPALGILLPALGAALLGFVDDRSHVNPNIRLLVQALLASVVWFTGTRLDFTGVATIDFVIFILWVMAIVNGINLLDNSDGLAGSTTFLSALGAGVVALFGGQELISIMGFALAGSALGFLWQNWHPAKVYLGDAGAYFLGFMLAILVVRVSPANASVWQGIAIALLLVLLPLVDTTYVVVKRLSKRTHPFTAGRDHLSHKLQTKGASVPESVVRLQTISVVAVMTAIALAVAAL